MDEGKDQGAELFRALLERDDTPRLEGSGAPGRPPPPPDRTTIDLTSLEGAPAKVQEHELSAALESGHALRRRTALRALSARELTPRLAEAVGSVLGDPNADLRLLALEVLERAPHLAPQGALETVAHDWDPAIRARALAALGRTRRLEAVAVIGERLVSEGEAGVVAAGLTALGQLLQTSPRPFPPASLQALCAAVGGLPAGTRVRHGSELGLIAKVLREDDLVGLLQSAEVRVRVGAAALAIERGSHASYEALATRTGDPEPEVRDLAIDAVLRSQRKQIPSADAFAGFDVSRFGRRSADVMTRRGAAPHQGGGGEPGGREGIPVSLEELEPGALRTWAEQNVHAREPENAVRAAELVRSSGRRELVPYLCAAILELPEGEQRDRVAGVLREHEDTWSLVRMLIDDPRADRRAKAVRLAAAVDASRTEPFMRALDDPNSAVRLAAISLLPGPVDPRLADRLMELVTADTSSRARVAATGRFWDAQAPLRIAAAQQALRSQDPAVRVAAVELLVEGSEEEMGLLARAIHDPEPGVAARAILYLGSLRAPQALALLWSSMRQVSAEVRELILEALEDFDRDAVLFLGRQALDGHDPWDRVLGLMVLSRLDTGTERLIAALDDPAPEVRLESLRNLRRHQDPAAVPAVGARLRDPDVRVRSLALEVLQATEDDRVLPFFVDGAKDPSPEVRRAARAGLLAHSPDAVAHLLLKALRFSSHRRAAADLLTEMGEAAIEHLSRALTGAEPEIRRTIGQILTSSGAATRLVREVSERDPERRLRAIESLGAMGSAEAVQPLIGRLQDPDARVRARAATILGELGDPAAVPALKKAFVTDPDMDVVGAIEPALRRLTETDGG